MKVFRLEVANRPGEIARVSRWFADAQLNINSVVSFAAGDRGWVEMSFSDPEKAQEILREHYVPFTAYEFHTISVPDRPGELHRIAQELADRDINIESLYLMGCTAEGVTLGLWTDKQEETGQVVEHLKHLVPAGR